MAHRWNQMIWWRSFERTTRTHTHTDNLDPSFSSTFRFELVRSFVGSSVVFIQSVTHSLNCGVGFYFFPSLSLTRRPIVFNAYRAYSIVLDTISALTVLYLGTRVGKAFHVPKRAGVCVCVWGLCVCIDKIAALVWVIRLRMHVYVRVKLWRRRKNTKFKYISAHKHIQASSFSASRL